MSLKQFGTKLLTMHIFHQKETRSIHQNMIMVVFFRDIFWLWAESKRYFQRNCLVIQFYWKLKSILETSFEIYWSLKIKFSFKLGK